MFKTKKMKKEQNIVFFNDDHSYWCQEKQLSSVGSIIKNITPKFQEDYWIIHTVLKNLVGGPYKKHYASFKKFGPPAEMLFKPFLSTISPVNFQKEKKKIKDAWGRKRNEAAFNGSNFHDMMEKKAYTDKKLHNPWTNSDFVVKKKQKHYDNESWGLDLSKLKDGAYLELIVFDLDWGIAGQVDMAYIETIDGIRYVDINDHKTNEKKPSKSSPERCKPPFQDQYASTHFKYTLQLNAYALLMQQHGFTPRNIGYTYYKNYDPSTADLVEVEHIYNKIQSFLENHLEI